MERIQVVLDDTALKELQLALQESPKIFYQVVNNVIMPQAQTRVEAALNQDPGAVKYPFEFASAKSRRYYFATHKTPYQRTGEVRKWRLFLKAFSGRTVEMTLENPTPYARYVFGDARGQFRTPGHVKTGWANVANEVPALTASVLSDLSEAWLVSLDRKGA